MQFKAKGNGLNWQDDLSKSLNGEGEIDIKDGYIKGGKVISKVLKAPFPSYTFNSLASIMCTTLLEAI